MEQNCLKCFSAWDVYIWVCRLWGTVTAMMLWGVGVEITYYGGPGFHIGIYILFVAAIVSFFESVFVVIFWIDLLKREPEQSCFVCLWKKGFDWVNNWKKGVLYILLSTVLFVEPKSHWLAMIPGTMLILSGIFYIIKTLKTRRDKKEEEERIKNQTYGRFDADVQEDIEANTVETCIGRDENMYGDRVEEIDVEETVEDQEEILDV